MFAIAKGHVLAIIHDNPELQELLVQVSGRSLPEKGYNYPKLNRRLKVGDPVILNTTAVQLGLGTGGRHFVIPDLDEGSAKFDGHIMKLRYTPWQFPILAAEEAASPFHEQLAEALSLEGTPVVAAPLHSMLPGIILGFRNYLSYVPKVAYVMTDAAALPIALSGLVRKLKEKRLLDLTVTTGHAFGGDLEAVSIPSALLTAYQAAKPDLIIVALGPGIVGTGTKLGFSGIEQSWILDLAARLGGIPVAAPRISFADSRRRHYGISHHTLTVLELTNNPVSIGLSAEMAPEFSELITASIKRHKLTDRHQWYLINAPEALNHFAAHGIEVTTMGRGINEDPWFFQHSVIAGIIAAMARNGELTFLRKIDNGVSKDETESD